MDNLINKLKNEPIYDDESSVYLDSKLRYLKENYTHENTIITYWRLFTLYILPTEMDLQKNLYNFNEDDIKDLIISLPTTSVRVKFAVSRLINLFIDWALQNKYTIGNNPFNKLNSKELIKINNKALSLEYYSWDEMFEIAETLKVKGGSYHCITTVLLCRMGVYGEGATFLLNLRKDDIDRENNKINIVNHDTGELITQIPITDERIYKWIDGMIEETSINENNTKLYEIDGRLIKSFQSYNETISLPKIYGYFNDFFLGDSVKKASGKKLSFKKLIRCAKWDLLDDYLLNKGVLTIDDFKKVQRIYEPNCSDTSYFPIMTDYKKYNPNALIDNGRKVRKVE